FSLNGKCGTQNGNKLCGKWGTCCNKAGVCGTGNDFCAVDNQPRFGTCSSATPTAGVPAPTPSGISPDGTCGGKLAYKCKGSTYGDCCSASGFCGSTASHCTAGCQSASGTCTVTELSPDGTCGGTNKYKCKGSGFGDCCSSAGYCGSTTHCAAGCQSAFGTCTTTDLSPDGTCGGTNKYKCKGSGFGDCCSPSGYCGSTTAHCTTGCQSAFGTCTSTPTSSTAPRPSDVSPDGMCGGTKNLKCTNSGFGNCCSKTGFCGDTISHCAQGCQTKFATKCLTTNIPTLDGSCGSTKGSFTCASGPFDGQCCSAGGFCGSTTDHCKA
ncbi:hypothetical protein EJ07DRAFT_91671, partial [Lizonia empirigonia]